MKRIIFGMACLLLSWPLFSQQAEGRLAPLSAWLQSALSQSDIVSANPFSATPIAHTTATGTFYTLQISAKTLEKVRQESPAAISLQVPMPDGTIASLTMAQSELFTSDFMVTTRVQGQAWATPYTPALLYRGLTQDEQDDSEGLAVVALSANCLRAIFEYKGRRWVLGPKADNPLQGRYILYATEAMSLPLGFRCVSEQTPSGSTLSPVQTVSRTPSENCVRVHVEVNFGLFDHFNQSVKETADYVAFMYHVVSTLYYLEQINTVLGQIQIWTTPDPYPTGTSKEILKAFGATVQDAIGGDLGHLLARYPDSLGNNRGGYAWINVLCNNYNPVDSTGPYAYSNVSGFFEELPTYSWDVGVVAHEMGHNLGAFHTHNCVWNNDSTQIDDCGNVWLLTNGEDDDNDGAIDNIEEATSCFDSTNVILPAAGTIMSYCHLIDGVGIDLTLGFDTQVGDLIRASVAAASCLAPCDSLCHASLHLFDPITEPADWEADQYIIAQNVVTIDSGIVDYDAGQYIALKPGFHATVDSGAIFRAFIDGCGNERPALSGPPPLALRTAVVTTPQARLSVQPNPADFSFQLKIEIKAKDQQMGLYLTDQLGRIVKPISDRQWWPPGTQTLTVLIADLTPGLYYLVCETDLGRQATPIMIQH